MVLHLFPLYVDRKLQNKLQPRHTTKNKKESKACFGFLAGKRKVCTPVYFPRRFYPKRG
jgi:hypothetical protein